MTAGSSGWVWMGVAEASVAFELARAAREKFGGDAIGDFVAAHSAYLERIPWSAR